MDIIKKIFSEQIFIFNLCFNCLNLSKYDNVDFTTYADIVNPDGECFGLSSITNFQSKYLIFACGFYSPSDAEVRTWILSKIEQNLDITLQQMAVEC